VCVRAFVCVLVCLSVCRGVLVSFDVCVGLFGHVLATLGTSSGLLESLLEQCGSFSWCTCACVCVCLCECVRVGVCRCANVSLQCVAVRCSALQRVAACFKVCIGLF